LSTLITLWWLSFWTAFGLCVGSFLNAVIYRLPRQGSLGVPRWSFCPVCGHRIRWYDNFPILSFLILRGRCRRCGAPIATRYVVVEASMAIVVLALLDAFFVGGFRKGLCQSPFGLTDELAYDWPILLAHVILFACLLCMSAIDLEHYWVDVRVTNLASVAGFLFHTLWTPPHSQDWIRPEATTAVVCLMALGGLALVWIVRCCHASEPGDEGTADWESNPSLYEFTTPEGPRQWSDPFKRPSRLFAWLAVLLLVAAFVGLFFAARGYGETGPNARGLVPLIFFFVIILRESFIVRPSDQEIVEAIEGERFFARRVALGEFGLLLPALVLGIVGYLIMASGSPLAARLTAGLHQTFHINGLSMLRQWEPLWGFATAAAGYVIGGALGWAVRILFTLLFGKEAFGLGDIHLMAAAGCVAGWPVAVLGFFGACVLAMIGWLIALPFKRSRAMPLGPWLSLSFLGLVVFYEPIVQSSLIQRVTFAATWLLTGNSQG
jgi:prepilin signal peptidase PulO-like enzyme (type II secretory pathway)